MARIRTIKPDFWDDEKMAKLSLQSNLLYIGMWNFSDDSGIIRKSPNWIKSNIFPHREEIRLSDVKSWIKELEDSGRLIPFEYNEEGYYWLPKFKSNQRIDKPHPSKVPKEVIDTLFQEYSKNIPRTFVSVMDSIVMDSNGEVGSPEILMKDYSLDVCKLDKSSIGFKVMEAAFKLYSGFTKEYPKNKDLPLVTVKEWVIPVRILIEKKGYTYDRIADVLLWSLKDKWWSGKILNTKDLNNNFEKMKLEYQKT